ncbi:hypothetical protein RHSIM_Rhsim10G0154500 [Rhododendron simsii]|uniref:Uncharacterized protein n=1 Tax=Rhododendron simsii TaxID=118357 RepID=A0A834GAI1_RHOSS|nr:hypothetical protein RHSIM_Rhsim10G0154500 [Rhododendron simsii]
MANSATNFNGTTSMSHRSRIYKSASEKTPESLPILCDFLREYGAAVPIDNRGDTVLHLLAINGNKAAFESLLQAGLLTDEALAEKNIHGNTALHEAARSGQTEVAEIMLTRKQDLVFLRNDMDETPLYVAAAYGKREAFGVLENYSSDCMTRRRDGRTILHAAVDGERYRGGCGKRMRKRCNTMNASCRFIVELIDNAGSIVARAFAPVIENMFRITAQYLKDNMDEITQYVFNIHEYDLISNIKTDDEYCSGDASILEASSNKTCRRQLFMPESSTIAVNDDDLLLAIAFTKKKND